MSASRSRMVVPRPRRVAARSRWWACAGVVRASRRSFSAGRPVRRALLGQFRRFAMQNDPESLLQRVQHLQQLRATLDSPSAWSMATCLLERQREESGWLLPRLVYLSSSYKPRWDARLGCESGLALSVCLVDSRWRQDGRENDELAIGATAVVEHRDRDYG